MPQTKKTSKPSADTAISLGTASTELLFAAQFFQDATAKGSPSDADKARLRALLPAVQQDVTNAIAAALSHLGFTGNSGAGQET